LKRNQPSDEGEFFIGARLAARRQKLGIPIEKVAHDIRMPLSRLRSLETDDFSGFPHPTYARLYLIDYANYLNIPLADIQDYLPSNQKLGTSDNAYLEVMLSKQNFMQSEQFKSLRRLLKFVGAGVAVALVIAAGIYFWRGWKKIERVQPAAESSSLALPDITEGPINDESSSMDPALLVSPVDPPLPSNPEPDPTPAPQLAQPYQYPASSAAPAQKPTPSTMILPPFEPAPRLPRPQ
jgi:cytoskeleton protein RodZ